MKSCNTLEKELLTENPFVFLEKFLLLNTVSNKKEIIIIAGNTWALASHVHSTLNPEVCSHSEAQAPIGSRSSGRRGPARLTKTDPRHRSSRGHRTCWCPAAAPGTPRLTQPHPPPSWTLTHLFLIQTDFCPFSPADPQVLDCPHRSARTLLTVSSSAPSCQGQPRRGTSKSLFPTAAGPREPR